jgi:hypothetical protein
VFNALVWEVEIEERPTGHIALYVGERWWSPHQQRDTHLFEPRYDTLAFPYSQKRIIAHAESLFVKLIHWLSPTDVTMFKERISSNKESDIDFQAFRIWAVKGPEGNKRRFRITLPTKTHWIPELAKDTPPS